MGVFKDADTAISTFSPSSSPPKLGRNLRIVKPILVNSIWPYTARNTKVSFVRIFMRSFSALYAHKCEYFTFYAIICVQFYFICISICLIPIIPFFIVASIVSVVTVFWRTVGRIQKIFSLKPSAPQGKSSFKILARWGSPFRRS